MLDETALKMLENYNKGLGLYRSMKFEESLSCFKKALEIKPDDGPSAMYVERCREYIKNPPSQNWDGVFVMTTK
jgi:tetratricopeptide (TPR) repeat protein